MFPLSLPSQWHCATDTAEHIELAAAKSWIQSQSSLTVKIKELGIAFNLQLLNQTEQALTATEQALLASTDSTALFREVLLKQGDTPLVYAQTIIPISTISGAEQNLAELGEQPLGQVLFQSSQATRGAIEYAKVTRSCPLGQFVEQQLGQTIAHNCYIRRSKFVLNHKPLLVSECFLPALFE